MLALYFSVSFSCVQVQKNASTLISSAQGTSQLATRQYELQAVKKAAVRFLAKPFILHSARQNITVKLADNRFHLVRRHRAAPFNLPSPQYFAPRLTVIQIFLIIQYLLQ